MVINVHIKLGLDREHVKACWNSVATECSAHPAALAICIGDMNAISEGEGRFDMRDGMVYHGDVWRDRTFWETCSDFIEVFQPEATRREVRNKIVVSVSRLDRCFIRGCTQDVMDMRPTLSVIGRATEVDSVSDHAPISLRLS